MTNEEGNPIDPQDAPAAPHEPKADRTEAGTKEERFIKATIRLARQEGVSFAGIVFSPLPEGHEPDTEGLTIPPFSSIGANMSRVNIGALVYAMGTTAGGQGAGVVPCKHLGDLFLRAVAEADEGLTDLTDRMDGGSEA